MLREVIFTRGDSRLALTRCHEYDYRCDGGHGHPFVHKGKKKARAVRPQPSQALLRSD